MTTALGAAASYAAKVVAVREQHARLLQPRGGDRWASRAASFRLDPARELDANTAAIVSLIEPLDTVIDIGGGAGRVSLPMALRCTEVINVEPSAAMREQFETAARDAGINNARAIDGNWPEGSGHLDADVVITSNVTYFVADILPFLEAMDRAAGRLAAITVWTIPPPDRVADIFQLVYGEPLARTPTHLDLLAALWEIGVIPNVRVLPDRFRGFRSQFDDRDQAITSALETVDAAHVDGARARLEQSFDNLFRPSGFGFEATWLPADSRELIISWTPQQAREDGG